MRPLVVFHRRRKGIYGLNALAGALEAVGLDREVDRLGVDNAAQLASALATAEEQGRPAMAAWSYMSPEKEIVHRELAAVRAVAPSAFHVAGGAHTSALPEDALVAGFDRVALGDGEATFTALVRAWLDGGDIDAIAGLARLENGKLKRNAPVERHDLDDWPPFAPGIGWYHPIDITRGCRYACRYCQTPFLSKARFRHRSLDAIGHWVDMLLSTDRNDIRFVTPSAMSYGGPGPEANLDAVEDLMILVRKLVTGRGRFFFGSFPSECRPEHLDDRAIRLLQKYVENDNLVIGAQSGSERMLRACNRGHTAAQAFEAAKRSVAAGFKTYVDIILGLPDETIEDMRETLVFSEALANLGARVHAHTFMPLPGTPWAGRQETPLPEEIRLGIERMATAGKLFGQWQRQARTADHLRRILPQAPCPPAAAQA